MGLREVAEELYSATPAEFTASRNAAAGRADDKALAKEIRALRKPSASAAVVNSLVREKPDLVDSILEVGDRMRDAFAARDRDSIRSLTGDRQRLLQTAVRSVGDVSPAVQREIEETLQAAVIDPSAAAAVRSGLLTRALESTGVDEVDVSDAVALPIDGTAPPRRPSVKTDDRTKGAEGAEAKAPPAEPAESAADRRERERRIRTAEKALERAKTAADTLDDELDAEVDRRGDLEAEREELSRRLERTENELAESKAAERDLRRRITQAQSAVRSAEKDARAARER
jgi:chaperonin cofactor prefoldin